MMEVIIISCSFTNGSKQKIKMKTEYHGILISFKSQFFSKQESSIFFLFGSWSLVISPCLGKVEVQLYNSGRSAFAMKQ